MLLLSYVLPSAGIDIDLLGKDSSTQKGYTYHLFVLPSDPEKEKWEGLPIGLEGAIKFYHADEVCPCPKSKLTNFRPPPIHEFPLTSLRSSPTPKTYTSPSPQCQAPSPTKSDRDPDS